MPKTQRAPFHQGKPKIVLSEEESKVLFFSVGRKRGVGPKDIITLLMQNVELPREHIGEIKILDNYCFVQVKTENADAVIAQLNNFRYRGRSLSVSYATVKTEKSDDVFAAQQDDNSSVAMPYEEQVGSQEI